MLSILIPTYNFDCSAFVQVLSDQAEALHIPYEIIVCDDGSTDETSKIGNRTINAAPTAALSNFPKTEVWLTTEITWHHKPDTNTSCFSTAT